MFKTSFLINADKTFDEIWREQPTPIKPENGSPIANIERWVSTWHEVDATDHLNFPSLIRGIDSLVKTISISLVELLRQQWTSRLSLGPTQLLRIENGQIEFGRLSPEICGFHCGKLDVLEYFCSRLCFSRGKFSG